ncbi:unnamed protein product, partial [Ectocarpus sp. 6 AP-2014]
MFSYSIVSPTREPSKRQRKASESGIGEELGGGGAAQYHRRQRDYSSDKVDRHNAGVARGTTARHGHCTAMKPDFRSNRAKQGVAHISQTCGHPACMTRPSFGKAGRKEVEFCSRHQKQGMVDLVNKKCGHPGCIKSSSFSEHGSTKREFCSQHAKEGMGNVVSKRCGHPGCMKHPTFGQAGSKKVEFCSPHAKQGMVNVV